MLFTERSVWTMVHGIVLSGAALMAFGAALFFMSALRAGGGPGVATRGLARPLAWLISFGATVLWLVVLVGTYIVFPPYRATPPPGTIDLAYYPRAMIMANPDTVWLHAFAMEVKEHLPWIASILATPVAFVGLRYGPRLLNDPPIRRMSMALLAICLMLVSFVGLMGIFVNKVAPLQ